MRISILFLFVYSLLYSYAQDHISVEVNGVKTVYGLQSVKKIIYSSGVPVFYFNDGTTTEVNLLRLDFPIFDSLNTNIVTKINSCDSNENPVVVVSIGGGLAPMNVLWSNGDTGDYLNDVTPGWYNVTVSDATGWSVIDSVFIENYEPLMVSAAVTSTSGVEENDGSIVLSVSGGNPPYSVFWDNGQASAFIQHLHPGLYGFTVVDNAGCTFSDSIQVVASSVGLENFDSNQYLSLYPNPTKDFLYLKQSQGAQQISEIQICLNDGRILSHSLIEQSENQLIELYEVKDMESGAYLIRILFANGGFITKSFIKL